MARYLDGRVMELEPVLSPLRYAMALLPAVLAGNEWYGKRHFYSEMRAMTRWLAAGNQLFHFLFGENSFRYLGYLKHIRDSNKIVCTFHVPPDRFGRFVKHQGHLSHVDAAIVVSTRLLPFYTELLGTGRVFFVPHGVDIEHFCPPKQPVTSRGLACLFVGQYLRDFESLAHVAASVGRANPEIRFRIVTNEPHHHYFKGLENTTLHDRISDEQLLQFYQTSDLFVFPLLDCTANCSLLEALACGLPVVTTDLVGTRDYTDSDCAILTPKGNAEAMADAVLALAQQPRRRAAMSEASRARALTFSWERVADQVRQVYQAICLG